MVPVAPANAKFAAGISQPRHPNAGPSDVTCAAVQFIGEVQTSWFCVRAAGREVTIASGRENKHKTEGGRRGEEGGRFVVYLAVHAGAERIEPRCALASGSSCVSARHRENVHHGQSRRRRAHPSCRRPRALVTPRSEDAAHEATVFILDQHGDEQQGDGHEHELQTTRCDTSDQTKPMILAALHT